jgi:hypothetical protein
MGIFVEFDAINQETLPSIFPGEGVFSTGAAVILDKDGVTVAVGGELGGAAHETSMGMISKNSITLFISITS